jgi:6-phosphogluconolactonase
MDEAAMERSARQAKKSSALRHSTSWWIGICVLRRQVFTKILSKIYLIVVTTCLIACDDGKDRTSDNNAGSISHAGGNAQHVAPSAIESLRLAHLADAESGSVASYTFDPRSGQLRRSGYATAGSLPRSITVAPSGKFAYAVNDLADEISVFAVDTESGTLAKIGTALATGTTPKGVTVHPSGKFAYVPNFGSNDISIYAIDLKTGTLILTGGAVVAGTSPLSVSVEADGKLAYVTNSNSNTALTYSIDSATGALTPTDGPSTAGANPFSVPDTRGR